MHYFIYAFIAVMTILNAVLINFMFSIIKFNKNKFDRENGYIVILFIILMYIITLATLIESLIIN